MRTAKLRQTHQSVSVTRFPMALRSDSAKVADALRLSEGGRLAGKTSCTYRTSAVVGPYSVICSATPLRRTYYATSMFDTFHWYRPLPWSRFTGSLPCVGHGHCVLLSAFVPRSGGLALGDALRRCSRSIQAAHEPATAHGGTAAPLRHGATSWLGLWRGRTAAQPPAQHGPSPAQRSRHLHDDSLARS